MGLHGLLQGQLYLFLLSFQIFEVCHIVEAADSYLDVMHWKGVCLQAAVRGIKSQAS
jgi:hypothetical protein